MSFLFLFLTSLLERPYSSNKSTVLATVNSNNNDNKPELLDNFDEELVESNDNNPSGW